MGILLAILLFSFLIFIHELGHFIAAKLSGVQVNEFSMFMGPALIKWKRGETQYSIRCIPIGGYCAMEGENEDSDNPRAFSKASFLKKFIIFIAGSMMNIIVGILLMFIIALPKDTIVTPVIHSFDSLCTVQGEGKLQVGDEILEIDGETIYIANDISMIIGLNGGTTHDFVVLRNGEEVQLNDLYMEKHEIELNGEKYMGYGITFTQTDMTFPMKLQYTIDNSIDTVRNIRLSLQMLITGKAGLSDVAGPVGIAHTMSEVTESAESFGDSVMYILSFGAFLAINLGVMNLLPIPALDGGHVVGLVLTAGYEKITKKKINPKFESYLHGIGMILLLALMAIIMFKDIFVIFKG